MVYSPSDKSGSFFAALFGVPFLFFSILLIKESIQKSNWGILPVGVIIFLFSLYALYLVYAVSKLKYIIDEKSLIIKWGFKDKIFDLSSISNIELKTEVKALKVAGFNMPGLLFGTFEVAGYQNVVLYATKQNDVIFFKHKWETIGISPENPVQFMQEIKKAGD